MFVSESCRGSCIKPCFALSVMSAIVSASDKSQEQYSVGLSVHDMAGCNGFLAYGRTCADAGFWLALDCCGTLAIHTCLKLWDDQQCNSSSSKVFEWPILSVCVLDDQNFSMYIMITSLALVLWIVTDYDTTSYCDKQSTRMCSYTCTVHLLCFLNGLVKVRIMWLKQAHNACVGHKDRMYYWSCNREKGQSTFCKGPWDWNYQI